MLESKVVKNLKSAGKGCFVKHHELLSNFGISNEIAIKTLISLEGYKPGGAHMHVTFARQIIREGQNIQALELVADAKRVPLQLREKARRLIAEA